MGQNQPTSDSLEALKVEVDRLKVAIDQARHQNELDRTFLERWRTELQPLHDHRMKSRDQGHDYAKAAFQMIFVLNGGALIAFPAFAQLTGNGFKQNLPVALGSIAGFVVGLVLIATAALFVGGAFSEDGDAIEADKSFVRTRMHQFRAPEAARPNFEKEKKEHETRRDEHNKTAKKWSVIAAVLACLALFAFVVGAGCAALVLSSAT